METKADRTTAYIIETVAPIFNKYGYAATSMSDITKATGLTKGAIYGNFENKEQLAVEAFNFSVKKVLTNINYHLTKSDSPLERLYLITDFYRNYYDYTSKIGGCPILNIGVDANNQDTPLLERVAVTINKIQEKFAQLIEMGIDQGELKEDINPTVYAKRFFAIIEGAIFMSFTMKDRSYVDCTMDTIDAMITNELKK